MTQAIAASGQCLCGGVRYQTRSALRNVIACHCTQCRQTSGNFVAATRVPTDDLQLIASSTLRWYRSSESAERGFCERCGGNLFWRETGSQHTGIMAGTVDVPTGLRTVEHIFTADKS